MASGYSMGQQSSRTVVLNSGYIYESSTWELLKVSMI